MRVDFAGLFCFLVVYLIIRSFMLVSNRKKKKRNYIGKEIMNALFFVYIAFIISITLFPITFSGEASTFSEQIKLINWIPFKDYYTSIINEKVLVYRFFFESLVGNLLLLTPIIGYLCCYNRKIRKIRNVILISFLISFSIEGLQLIQNVYLGQMRSVDTSDLVSNIISGLIGYGIFKILYKTKLRKFVRAI